MIEYPSMMPCEEEALKVSDHRVIGENELDDSSFYPLKQFLPPLFMPKIEQNFKEQKHGNSKSRTPHELDEDRLTQPQSRNCFQPLL